MNGKLIRSSLDAVLRPYGFERIKSVWVRDSGPYKDVVTIQSSHSEGTCTLNCGVYADELHKELWDRTVVKRPQLSDADCVVRSRAGLLKSDGKTDYWWPVSNPSSPAEMASAAIDFILPFLDDNHSFEAMIKTLEMQGVDKYTGFPDSYFLALLYLRVDSRVAGCSLLYKLRDKALKLSGDSKKANELMANYSCNAN
jgi:Domain of unknown function (DUF4304)